MTHPDLLKNFHEGVPIFLIVTFMNLNTSKQIEYIYIIYIYIYIYPYINRSIRTTKDGFLKLQQSGQLVEEYKNDGVCVCVCVCVSLFKQTKYYQHQLTLPKKYAYSQLFWSDFSHIWT